MLEHEKVEPRRDDPRDGGRAYYPTSRLSPFGYQPERECVHDKGEDAAPHVGPAEEDNRGIDIETRRVSRIECQIPGDEANTRADTGDEKPAVIAGPAPEVQRDAR